MPTNPKATFVPGGGAGSAPTSDPEVLARISAMARPETAALRVSVEAVERDTPSPEELIVSPGRVAINVKVRVASTQKDPFPLVAPNRFCLRFFQRGSPDLRKLTPMSTTSKEPTLPTRYLRTGDETEGWLRFLVPGDAESVTVRSDLTTSETAIPIAIPPAPKSKRRTAQ